MKVLMWIQLSLSFLKQNSNYTNTKTIFSCKPNTNITTITESEIMYLLIESKKIISNQPVLLELSSPLNICGKLLINLT